MAVLLPIGMSEGFSATQRNSSGSDEILVFPIKQPRFLVIQSFSFKPSGIGVVGLIFDHWLVGGEIPHG
tara:strand:- start:992 stop:1198 length:207 start_codon:yes stop_codon:yes gene_type:complete